VELYRRLNRPPNEVFILADILKYFSTQEALFIFERSVPELVALEFYRCRISESSGSILESIEILPYSRAKDNFNKNWFERGLALIKSLTLRARDAVNEKIKNVDSSTSSDLCSELGYYINLKFQYDPVYSDWDEYFGNYFYHQLIALLRAMTFKPGHSIIERSDDLSTWFYNSRAPLSSSESLCWHNCISWEYAKRSTFLINNYSQSIKPNDWHLLVSSESKKYMDNFYDFVLSDLIFLTS
jgi:hypothetical protein